MMKPGAVCFVLFATMQSAAFASDNAAPAFDKAKFEVYHSLQGHIPKAVKAMSDHGKLDNGQVLSVTIALQLNNEEELNQRIEEMYRPGSPTFHQFITPQEFLEKYAPTAAQIAQEKAFLAANGITVQNITDNRVFLNSTGSVSAFNTAFKTEIHKFVRNDGKEYFSPAYELQAPVASRITAVIGLNNAGEAHSHLKVNHAGKAGANSGAITGVTPSQIHTAYNLPSNLDGSGQTLALVEFDGYKASNIAAYERQFGLPATPLQNILIGGFSGKPTTGANSGEVEVELDIEMMVAVAPKATQILVYEGPLSGNTVQGVMTSFINVYSKIASDNASQIISSSWGVPEDQVDAGSLQSENTVFKQMVAQGQTFFVAAGDAGAEDDTMAKVAKVAVDDPSDQPYVVSVGGTRLTMDANSNWQSETTWNELNSNPKLSEGAGGGGISKTWSIPSWQVAAVASNSQSSKTMRNVPDVSLNADPETGYGVYVSSMDPSTKKTTTTWATIGGTSAASPLWAAFTALVNQSRAAKGLSPTGFLNPLLYAVGTSSAYDSCFHDIADGSNNGNASGAFNAVRGYDNATGWGSYQATNLLNELSN